MCGHKLGIIHNIVQIETIFLRSIFKLEGSCSLQLLKFIMKSHFSLQKIHRVVLIHIHASFELRSEIGIEWT